MFVFSSINWILISKRKPHKQTHKYSYAQQQHMSTEYTYEPLPYIYIYLAPALTSLQLNGILTKVESKIMFNTAVHDK